MPPRFATDNSADRRPRNSIVGGNNSVALSRLASPNNFARLYFREFRVPLLFPAQRAVLENIVAVTLVARLRNPLQVFDAIIRLDTVFMVDLVQWRWRWPKKGPCHKTMNLDVSLLATPVTQSYLHVAA